MGRTACAEPQCLYKGALYLYLTVELYLYSRYGPYGLCRASVPVQGCILPFYYFYLYGGQFSFTLTANKTRAPRVLVFSRCVLRRSIYITELNVHPLQYKIDSYKATD